MDDRHPDQQPGAITTTSSRGQARAVTAAMIALRMPDIAQVLRRMRELQPNKATLYVSPEGKAFVLADVLDSQITRDHAAWLVGTYGGPLGLPSEADLEGDVRHHLTAVEVA